MVAKNKISGVICEFNPLHNGHKALLSHIKQNTNGPVICVMSGNFVQRGEPAALDKWSRAKLALHSGKRAVVQSADEVNADVLPVKALFCGPLGIGLDIGE